MKIPRNTCQRSRRYSESMRSTGSGAADGAGRRKESTNGGGRVEIARRLAKRIHRFATLAATQKRSQFQLLAQPARAICGDAHDSESDPVLRDFDVIDGPYMQLQAGVLHLL